MSIPRCATCSPRWNQAQVQIEEAAHSLTRYVDRLELDPERLQAVEARMQALHTAARKYRLPPEQLPDELLARRQQLDDLQAAQDINKVLAREAAARAAYLTLARHLSAARKTAAKALSGAVTDAACRACRWLAAPSWWH